jgi:hypothetical protein
VLQTNCKRRRNPPQYVSTAPYPVVQLGRRKDCVAERTPRTAAMPQNTLDQCTPIASVLDDLAADASKNRIAQSLNVSPAGGAFRSRLASARTYGLIERKSGDVYGLSERGRCAISADRATRDAARQQAVMATGFGAVIRRLSGREPTETTVRARLADDFSVPETSAANLALTLIRTATEVGLVANGRFDAAAIEAATQALPPPEPAVKNPQGGERPRRRRRRPTEVRQPPTVSRSRESAVIPALSPRRAYRSS